jgi:hypothetical protein
MVLAALLHVSAVGADVVNSTLRSTEWGVELTVPRGWELSDQRSYPGVIGRAFEHKGSGHLLIAAERLVAGMNTRGYVERSQKKLMKVGYTITAVAQRDGGAIVVDSMAPDKKRVLC